jgi:hypothetical protein
MAGIFDRLKDRFTQYAAGTADTSALSEEQAKLLRRQAIGRLGASLYRDGDFGAGMEAQAKVNADRLAQEQERLMREQAQGLWQGIAGGTGPQQAPQLNPEQQRIMQTPRLIANPQTQMQQASIASQQAQPAQASGPTPDMRAALQQRIALAQSQGRDDVAEAMLEYAKQFAPLEEWFAPTEYLDPTSGQTRLGQFSKFGNQRLTDVQASPTDKIQSLRAMQQDPSLYQMEGQLRALGANRSVVNMPFERAFDQKLGTAQAEMLSGWQQQAAAAQDTLVQLSDLEQLLSQAQAQTGATPQLIAQIGRYVGAPNASTLEAVQSAAMPFVLSRMQQLGGGDSNEEMRAIRDSLPGFGISPQANEIILGAMRRAAQRSIQNYQAAEQYAQTPGNIGLRGYVPLYNVTLPSAEQDAPAGARPGSIANRYGLE